MQKTKWSLLDCKWLVKKMYKNMGKTETSMKNLKK